MNERITVLLFRRVPSGIRNPTSAISSSTPLLLRSPVLLKPHRPLLLEILRILTWSLARTTSERILQRIKHERYSRCLIRDFLTKAKRVFSPPYLGQIFQRALYFSFFPFSDHSISVYFVSTIPKSDYSIWSVTSPSRARCYHTRHDDQILLFVRILCSVFRFNAHFNTSFPIKKNFSRISVQELNFDRFDLQL